jgi:asparagine synthase (glutamine-hydrolysing)
MCGITGLVSLQGAPIDPAVLQRMTDRQAHRGPDGEGFLFGWEDEGGFAHKLVQHTRQWEGGRVPVRLALGHRRLAILDLSDRGLQPMPTGDGKCWIVFNGEIYNHRELRSELEGRGYTFGTRTDTEVLLQAYREWGEDCLARLQGMYAFAIWDGARRCLFAARDRLGIKPFYYATPGGTFAFASEMKALLVCPGLDAATDDDAVVGFLIHANCDYGERTLLREVKALPPGYCLTVHASTGRVDVRQYWQLLPEHANGVRDSVRLDGLRTLLTSTMQSHLMSDVRAGSCLSGGIDSSTVVSLIGKLWREQPDQATALGDRFLTFTSCWKYPELDERTYADAVARSAGAESHLVFPSAEDFWETFPLMAWHQDMPFPSISYYAQWSVMRAARDAGVKVLLDGQGGDEVFGGYAKFRYASLASLLRSGRLVRFALEAGAMMGQGDLNYVLNLRRGYRYLPTRLRRLLGVDSLLEGVLRTDWDHALGGESTPATRWWRYARAGASDDTGISVMQRIQVDDIMMDTLPLLLRMEDRSSMAFSLEARVPLLDHELVDYGISLPDHLKVHNGWSKFAIREVMRGVLPDAVRERTSKLGFAAPDRRWLAHDLRPQVTALIEDSMRCERFVDVAALRRWYASPEATGASEEAYLGLFRILALEMWMRAFDLR